MYCNELTHLSCFANKLDILFACCKSACLVELIIRLCTTDVYGLIKAIDVSSNRTLEEKITDGFWLYCLFRGTKIFKIKDSSGVIDAERFLKSAGRLAEKSRIMPHAQIHILPTFLRFPDSTTYESLWTRVCSEPWTSGTFPLSMMCKELLACFEMTTSLELNCTIP